MWRHQGVWTLSKRVHEACEEQVGSEQCGICGQKAKDHGIVLGFRMFREGLGGDWGTWALAVTNDRNHFRKLEEDHLLLL